jgi:hypothetical protein
VSIANGSKEHKWPLVMLAFLASEGFVEKGLEESRVYK